MVNNSTDIATRAFVAALNIPSRGYKGSGSSLERASPREDPILDSKESLYMSKKSLNWREEMNIRKVRSSLIVICMCKYTVFSFLLRSLDY